MNEFYHDPVMLREVIEILGPESGKIIIDCTLGGGGHTNGFLEKGAYVAALDRDIEAVRYSESKLKSFAGNFEIVKGRFSEVKKLLSKYVGMADGILMDLGLSSKMIDDPSRGFSYNYDSPLLMTMEDGLKTAAEVVNELAEGELYRIFKEFGEERNSRKIARAVVERRKQKPLKTTLDLSGIIEKYCSGGMPQKSKARIFQALRIYVNDEMGELNKGLEGAVDMIKTGGKICVISYHSLEDRAVKTFFRNKSVGCTCPPGFPVCVCGKKKELDLLSRKPIKPTLSEISANSRARSAVLRAAVKQ